MADAGDGLCRLRNPQIIKALDKAPAFDVVVVDLVSGKAWWGMRLLVLAAGADHGSWCSCSAVGGRVSPSTAHTPCGLARLVAADKCVEDGRGAESGH